ncbi:XRE family transcriptional regulator (plasmid) [Embleya sp. NBC_00888]|uniref:XRE family transcriptional regulator n=1 Tax=Embleya sp. NBC_00888 TaxID=2975960 RepID=UPI002F914C44|nr:XRE family transcriptional regulator [Embleya sp. NBC_00888]
MRRLRFRALVEERGWTSHRRFDVKFAMARDALAGREKDPRLYTVTVAKRTFERWMAGDVKGRPYPDTCRVLEHLFGVPAADLFSPMPEPEVSKPGDEDFRREIHDALTRGRQGAAQARVWEEVVLRHALATRRRPDAELLPELRRDFVALTTALEQPQSLAGLRTLTRTAAWMGGLMTLCLVRSGAHERARAWARTAWTAADEADDDAVRAWVLAEDAYGLFYAGDPSGAAALARRAQGAGGWRGVGAALAAPLEARAHALRGDTRRTHNALARAERVLETLTDDQRQDTAVGYTEAQFRFHQGNALTHLGDVDRAAIAHARALELYPVEERLDRALVRTDVATCRLHRGEAAGAALELLDALTDLPEPDRTGIVLARGRHLAGLMPTGSDAPEPVRALRAFLAEPTPAPEDP